MARTISLAHLSVLNLPPPAQIAAAAEAGFDAVGLRLLPARPGDAEFPMLGDTPMRREVLSLLKSTGLSVLDVEVIWLRHDTQVRTHEALFETAALLGSKHILTACEDPHPPRAAATLAALCDLAKPYGLALDIEFIRFTQMKTLAEATEIIGLAGRANAGILVDCLHAARTGVTPAEVAAADPARFAYFQICDAPAAPPANGDLLHEARFNRLLPGEGGLPLGEMMRALPPGIPASVEVALGGKLADLPPAEKARLMAAATRKVLQRFD